jgi:hypothetical protein
MCGSADINFVQKKAPHHMFAALMWSYKNVIAGNARRYSRLALWHHQD